MAAGLVKPRARVALPPSPRRTSLFRDRGLDLLASGPAFLGNHPADGAMKATAAFVDILGEYLIFEVLDALFVMPLMRWSTQSHHAFELSAAACCWRCCIARVVLWARSSVACASAISRIRRSTASSGSAELRAAMALLVLSFIVSHPTAPSPAAESAGHPITI
jgi:hypothetical protein